MGVGMARWKKIRIIRAVRMPVLDKPQELRRGSLSRLGRAAARLFSKDRQPLLSGTFHFLLAFTWRGVSRRVGVEIFEGIRERVRVCTAGGYLAPRSPLNTTGSFGGLIPEIAWPAGCFRRKLNLHRHGDGKGMRADDLQRRNHYGAQQIL